MDDVTRHPFLVFVLSLVILWFFAWLGAALFRRRGALAESAREDFGVILAATLTLLGLIIGFTFSMAISRYDLRKTYEEAEANAIGTEYVRADYLPVDDAKLTRRLLEAYTGLRIEFYNEHTYADRALIDAKTAQAQKALWSAIKGPTADAPTPIMALVTAGMNDVLNSQGYTQAAWWNRIPKAAWVFLILISALCNLMIGYGARDLRSRSILLVVLPLVVAISLFLIADIETPRGGIIRVSPQNLESLAQSFK
jgi:hypothetical protein